MLQGVDELYKWTNVRLFHLAEMLIKHLCINLRQRTDVPLERVDTIRDLRILIDEELSFKEHA